MAGSGVGVVAAASAGLPPASVRQAVDLLASAARQRDAAHLMCAHPGRVLDLLLILHYAHRRSGHQAGGGAGVGGVRPFAAIGRRHHDSRLDGDGGGGGGGGGGSRRGVGRNASMSAGLVSSSSSSSSTSSRRRRLSMLAALEPLMSPRNGLLPLQLHADKLAGLTPARSRASPSSPSRACCSTRRSARYRASRISSQASP